MAMKHHPEAIQWWAPDDSIAFGWGVLRRVVFLSPVIFFLRMYDDHWGGKSRRRADLHELARRARGEIPRDAPIPLPARRKRALTNPLPPLETIRSMSHSIRRSRQRTDAQDGSLLLRKLPLELRQIIWEMVLVDGNRTLVHIMRKNGRLGHWRCRIQDGENMCDLQGRRCVEGWLAYKAKMRCDKAERFELVTDGGLLPLLLTCRTVYSEAISILYAKHIFHFYDPGDIRYFARTILPQRVDSVHSIIMDWERTFSIFNKDNTIPKHNDEELKAWREIWEIIAKMQGLMELKVILKPHKFFVPRSRRKRMCRLMMDIHGLRTFELVVPWVDETDWSFAASAPFTIVRGPDRSIAGA